MPPEVTEPARQQRGDDTASVVADELYAEGVDALIDGDYFDASNSLSQCLQAKASLFGEDSLEAALVAVKYGSALLACLRARRDDGELAVEQIDDAGPSTSAGPAPTATDPESEELQLAWEVSDSARVVLHRHKDNALVTPELLMELHRTLGDVGTERDSYEEAVQDYEQAIAAADESSEVDLRQLADLHSRITVPLELCEEIDGALKHINTAVQQLRFLAKQKEAERQEAAAASTSTPAEQEQPGLQSPPSQSDEAALAAEVSELRALVAEAEERKAELTDVQSRVGEARNKLKELFSSLLPTETPVEGAKGENGASTSAAAQPVQGASAPEAGALGVDTATTENSGPGIASSASAVLSQDDAEREAKRARLG